MSTPSSQPTTDAVRLPVVEQGDAAGEEPMTMPTVHINGIDVHVEIDGDGAPLVLIHGNWTDHESWGAVAPLLARRHRVMRYDRRGHSRSGRLAGQVPRRVHEDDLAALIKVLGCGPAQIIGSSYGGLVALGLAARRPDLVTDVSVHEPPATAHAGDGELGALVADAVATVGGVSDEIAAGDVERATRRFVEEVALGPGAWEMLPEPMRAVFVANAPAFVADTAAAQWDALDIRALRRFPGRILITKGDASPRWFPLLVDRLVTLIPAARSATIAGAGHAPHLSHPDDYAALIAAFVSDEGGTAVRAA